MLRQEKGITLVALIVTIIILIILAGVSITSLTKEHGVIDQATDAKVMNAYNGASDQINLAFSTVRMTILSESTKDSNYDATANKEVNKYLESLQKDLPEKNGFTFYIDAANKEEVEGTETTMPAIYIKYSDTSLKTGCIAAEVKEGDEVTKVAEPAQNGAVYAKVIIGKQSTSYNFNFVEESLPAAAKEKNAFKYKPTPLTVSES